MTVRERAEAVVIGRVGVDLYPQQLNTPLEDVRTFEKFVGGFAGNVATGLARLGVRTMIVSAVGEDGHGRFVRRWLESEGVDVAALGTHATLRTALAFCEAWPPDRFPITFYREPTCPDWELRPEDMPVGAIRGAPLAYVTGTGLARDPSRTTTLLALEPRVRRAVSANRWTIFDLDWRETLWREPADYAPLARVVAGASDAVVGGEAEWRAADLRPLEAIGLGVRLAIVKHGPDGATLVDRTGERHVAGLSVPVTNGLGAGDAFAAALGAALLRGLDPAEAVRRANAAGAIVATRLSCSAAMPTPAEIDALLAGAPAAPTELTAAAAPAVEAPADDDADAVESFEEREGATEAVETGVAGGAP